MASLIEALRKARESSVTADGHELDRDRGDEHRRGRTQGGQQGHYLPLFARSSCCFAQRWLGSISIAFS